jgi:hypothetical protein
MPTDFQAGFSDGTQIGLTRLGTLAGGASAVSGARGIQHSGSYNYFTGYSTVTSGDTHAFYATLTGGSSSVTMTDLGTLSGDNCSWGNGINGNLHIVGFSAYSNGAPCDDGVGLSQKAWYLSNTSPPITLTQISNTLGGTKAAASAINNSDVVAGWADNSSGYMHAFTRSISGTTMTDLGLVNGYDQSWAWAIDGNTNADVAGFVCTHSSCSITAGRLAMLYNGSTSAMRSLGTLPGGSTSDFSEAFAVNNGRTVVGYSTKNYPTDTTHYAFVWNTTNGMKYLEDTGMLSNPDDWTSLSHARAIDNNGNIVGEGVYRPDGHIHAYLLTPDAAHTADFGGRQMNNSAVVPDGLLLSAEVAANSPVVPDGLLVAAQPAPTTGVAVEGSATASAAPSGTLDQFFVRDEGVPGSEWWEWTGADLP